MKQYLIWGALALAAYIGIQNLSAETGRYQLATKDNGVYLIDTKKGDTWELGHDPYGLRKWDIIRK